ncbi:hypothetical protein [Riemerella anatipestifer]|uniref:hypothetical protein n=1 Tax=Riemerella anatipestifer TaxID=34085 RepID=UPI0021F86760|nr:hypothetical protein [Riemerella anatipestifer]MCW0487193.1 hypothetical protein [Riemerella anatipestifer]
MNINTYKYHLRPEYKSENLLIEIFSGVENEKFLSELLNSISEINPKIEAIADLWMSDEIILTIYSECGNFSLSKDIWNLAFIMSNNQKCIHKINSILSKDARFEKVEVNFDDYK